MERAKLSGILFIIAGTLFMISAAIDKDIAFAGIGLVLIAIGCAYLAKKQP